MDDGALRPVLESRGPGRPNLPLDQRGELLLIHATPEKFDLLDSRKISEQETWGHLAISGERVFIRELNGVSAYRFTNRVP